MIPEEEKTHKMFIQRMWNVFTSPLPVGIWLLFSLLGHLLMFNYLKITWQNTNAQITYAQLLEAKLDEEIKHRFRKFQHILESSTLIEQFGIALAIGQLNGANSLFPEFQKRKFMSLLWELRQVVPEKEKAEVVTVIEAFQQLMEYSQHTKTQEVNVHDMKTIVQKEYLKGVFHVRGWMNE